MKAKQEIQVKWARTRAGILLIPTIFALFFLIACPVSGANRQEELKKSVVMIRSVSQEYNYRMPWKQQGMRQGVGTGFIISGRRILTNAHNVSNNKYVELKKQGYAQRYAARIVYIGHDCDLAILDVMDKSFYTDTKPLELGGIPRVNSTVMTMGFPIGGDQISVTEGVVSRVQMDTYSHTGADSHLVVQTDAAINPGNSGGPVMQDGKVVGVAFQGLQSADNIGYMIPTSVIRHFLKDISDGKYDGFGSMGCIFFPGLHNKSYREYLKVPAGKQGVVVLKTQLKSSVEKILRKGDVLTRIADYDIDNDGKVSIYGMRINMAEVIEQKQIGETVLLTFYRQGVRMQSEVQIRLNRGVLDFSRQYDITPGYVVYGGLTFVTLSRNFLESWGDNWLTSIPPSLRYLFYYSREINKASQRKEYVILGEILPDEINAYLGNYKYQPVATINSHPVWKLADVPEALAAAKGEFCVIKFIDNDKPLVLKTSLVNARQQYILQHYHIPSEKRIY